MKTITHELRDHVAGTDREVLDQALFETCGWDPETPETSPDLEMFLNALDARSLIYLPIEKFQNLPTIRAQAAAITLSVLRSFIRERSLAAASRPGFYDVLLGCLRKGDVIVSFNWDPLLEVAFRKAGRTFSYLPTTVEGTSLLLKPHGSITWFALLEHELLGIDGESGMDIVGGSLQYYMLFLKDPLAVPDLGDSTYFAKRAISPIPAFVLPGVDRAIAVGATRSSAVRGGHAGLMRETWGAFARCVNEADEIVAVGYSLPGTDATAIEVLRRYRERRKPLLIVDPNPGLVERYRRIVCDDVRHPCRDSEEYDPAVVA